MGRDGLFTCGYLGLAPILQEGLKPTLGDGSSFLVGGVAAGVIGAGVTHPLDTLKTVVQTRALDPDAKTQGQYMREIFQREGVAGFYSGFLPRAARTCGAVFILNASKSFLEGAWGLAAAARFMLKTQYITTVMTPANAIPMPKKSRRYMSDTEPCESEMSITLLTRSCCAIFAR